MDCPLPTELAQGASLRGGEYGWEIGPFQAFHHIYCNATDVPLFVRLIQQVPGDPTRAPQLQEISHRVRFEERDRRIAMGPLIVVGFR